MTVSQSPLVRVAELEIDDGQIETYTALLREEIEASVEREPGVLMLYALAVKGAPTQLRIVEVYADQAAYENHLLTPHFLAYKRATATMVKSLRLIETEPVILCAKPTR